LKDDTKNIKAEGNKKDNDKKINIDFTATTWGTLFLILILTVISVVIYEPIRNAVLGYTPLTDSEIYLRGNILRQDMM